MKVSELMDILKVVLDEFGDVPIKLRKRDCGGIYYYSLVDEDVYFGYSDYVVIDTLMGA